VTPMKITEKHIAAAEKLGACEPAITWLREKPRTLEELVEHNPDWAAWIIERIPAFAERAAAALLARPGGLGEYSLCRIVERAPAHAKRAWTALLALPGGPSEYNLRCIFAFVPAFAERAWIAMLAHPGGPSEYSLHWIVEYAPDAYREKARAELARRKEVTK